MTDKLTNNNDDAHNVNGANNANDNNCGKDEMLEPEKRQGKLSQLIIAALIIWGLWYLFNKPDEIVSKLISLKMMFIVALGFGCVIFVHEFGHFMAAKGVGILVEAFAIGFGPVVLGVKKTRSGFKVRFLPTIFPGADGNGAMVFTIPADFEKEGETEYQFRLIPLGGFVKMLGQEDIGPDKASDDPRAFNNKAVWKRAIVISAGVIMNVICGSIVFMLVFAEGVSLPPAVAGGVAPGMPAARAGIKTGDEIISINGKKNINFTDLIIGSVFTGKGEKVALTVKHPDGKVQSYKLAPEFPKNKRDRRKGIRILGIIPPISLTIDDIDTTKKINKPVLEGLKKLGLAPGDKIVAVNGKAISHYYQLAKVIDPPFSATRPKSFTLTVKDKDGKERTTRPIKFVLTPTNKAKGSLLGMLARLKVVAVIDGRPARKAGIKAGDVFVQVGAITNPVTKELRDLCKQYDNKPLKIVALRKQGDRYVKKTFTVEPNRGKVSLLMRLLGNVPNPTIGILLSQGDTEHPIVAKCIDYRDKKDEKVTDADKEAGGAKSLKGAKGENGVKGGEGLKGTKRDRGVNGLEDGNRQVEGKDKHGGDTIELPRGAEIVSIAGKVVHNWRDMLYDLVSNKGKTVQMVWRMPGSEVTKSLVVEVPKGDDWIGFVYQPDWGDLTGLPLKPLTRIYKGANWKESLKMGADQSFSFMAQTFLMFRGMFQGTVSPKTASGPVGILKMSYTIVSQRSITYYFYFMAIISVCIAVFNFLPLPVLDGGLFVLLIVEKIKGSPVSVKTQEILNYIGLVLIGMLFLYVTFNDIVKLVSGDM